MEPAADISWATFDEPDRILPRHWTVKSIDAQGRPDPSWQPTFWSRRRAERYARKHTCEHITYTVVPVPPCHETSARGMRGQQTVASAVVPPRPKTPPEPPPVSSGAPRNPYPG